MSLPPEGTLHEAFFDPVTVGTAVAADSANGVLKPAEFTDANGASATIERIAWEAGTEDSGTVKLKLSAPRRHCGPHPALHRPRRLVAALAESCRRDGRCAERHAELDGGVAAVG